MSPEQSSTPEEGRLAAHVFLDALSAWDPDAADFVNLALVQRAVNRLSEVGAVKATFDDETDEMSVDVSDLVGPAIVTMQRLAGFLAVREGRTVPDVVADLREFWDDGLP